jgi:hypothetical protein
VVGVECSATGASIGGGNQYWKLIIAIQLIDVSY